MRKLGFIGFGNMAYAIAKGILKENIVPTNNVFVYDVNETAREKAAQCGFTVVDNEVEAVKAADIILLCVKPQGFTDVLDEISDFAANKTFLSIAAGISIEKICGILGEVSVVRAMPNTPLLLACGTTALTKNDKTDLDIFNFIKSVFASVGTVYELPENKFNEVINLNGSTPAYIYYFAKIITEFAAECGIDENLAMNILCDTFKGSAEMLTKSGKSAQELIDMVSSKGGTTIAALDAFQASGFDNSLKSGLKAALNRAQELGKIK